MKRILFTLLILIATTQIYSQSGKVFDELTMESKILKSTRKYAIYLPPDYETSQRKYPVLYLLHGAGDDQTGWIQFGEVLHIADKAIREGKATPMIIVMPDANTGRRGYFNDIRGDFNYEDFFFQELIPHIEKTYKAKSEKRFRGIAGLSMGGGGTLVYALRRPEMFAAACPLSAAVRVTTPEHLRERYNADGKISEEKLNEWYKQYDILGMVEAMPDLKDLESRRYMGNKMVRFYIDCGDDDFLIEGNCMLHIAMTKKGYPHEFRVRDGGHTWEYWRTALPEVLFFVSQSFHQF